MRHTAEADAKNQVVTFRGLFHMAPYFRFISIIVCFLFLRSYDTHSFKTTPKTSQVVWEASQAIIFLLWFGYISVSQAKYAS